MRMITKIDDHKHIAIMDTSSISFLQRMYMSGIKWIPITQYCVMGYFYYDDLSGTCVQLYKDL